MSAGILLQHLPWEVLDCMRSSKLIWCHKPCTQNKGSTGVPGVDSMVGPTPNLHIGSRLGLGPAWLI